MPSKPTPSAFKVPAAQLGRIVDRCHVGDSHIAVCRYVLSRLAPGAFWALDRESRRAVLRAICERHTANRSLYRLVMRGGPFA